MTNLADAEQIYDRLPARFVVSQMAAEISQIMVDEEVTLEDLLAGLDEASEEVFRETYGDAFP